MSSIPLSMHEKFNRSLVSPLIVPALSPRRDRMRYFNALKKYKLQTSISIYCEEMAGRIIIGPSEFKDEIPFINLETCSQHDLDTAWKERAEMAEMQSISIDSDSEFKTALNDKQRMKEMSENAYAALGFSERKMSDEERKEALEKARELLEKREK